jgi:outer membrane protein assembly factor BamB
MDPQSGKALWTAPWQTDYDVNASTPVYRDGRLFITSNYDHGCAMYSLNELGSKKEWENKQVQSKFQPTILDGDRLYASDAGTLKCLHWPDGKLLWTAERGEPRLNDGGSFVLVGHDKIIALSERGRLFLLDVQPTGVKIAGQVNLFDESNVWSMPLVYHGKIYAKGKQELVCLLVSGQ